MGHDVIVIGGGLIGASSAFRLAQEGLRVLLLEKNHVGFGASGCTAAMLECQTEAHRGETFFSLALPSLRLYPSLHLEVKELTGINFELERNGILSVALTGDEGMILRRETRWQRDRSLRAEWLDATAVAREYPEVDSNPLGAALFCEDGQVNGERLLAGLVLAAERSGAEVRERVGDVSLVVENGRVVGVRTREGVSAADKIVVAAGAWCDQLLEPIGPPLGVRPVRGQLVYFERQPARGRLPVVTRRGFYVAPKSNFTIAGSTVEEAGFDTSVTPASEQVLIEQARRLVPALVNAQVRGSAAGLRPAATDSFLPFLGALEDHPNVIVAAGHFRNGVLLTPITAEIVRSLVTGRRPPVDITAYAVDRFRKRGGASGA
ncbi:MAG: glycine oxidase ThiO [Elusimicrobia bacterium]|nr:glycine oxidase ThiO [Elusimicrobiota bacterium]